MTEMIKREFEVRAVNEEERAIEGRAVPYGDVIDLGSYKERIEPGAFGEIDDNVKLFYAHNEPIGKVVAGRDEKDGFYIRAVISKTARGDEVYTLLKDGVLNRFSVGFLPVEDREEEDVIVRTKASLKEVSVVPFPAYENAHILSVRDSQTETAEKANTNNTKEVLTQMDKNEIAPEVAELREAVSILEREVNVLKSEGKDEGPAVPQFRSFGEYAKAVAKGDENSEMVHRVYTGGVHADVDLKNGWVNDVIRLVDVRRKATNAFSKGSLPAEGMTLEYGVLDTNSLATGTQAAEGDALSFGKVSVTSATADVVTIGGYTSLSRQQIERGNVNIVDLSFKGMAIEYAKDSEALVRAAVVGATGTTSVSALSADTAAGWLGLLADSAAALDDEGLAVDFLYVSTDVFKRLAVLVGSDGRPLLSYGNGVNTIGSASAVGLTANINGVPVLQDGALAANTCIVANKEAVRSYESGGAPFRLGPDDNITTLTRDYSVYGYVAVAVEIPTGLIIADVDLV